MTMLIGMVWSFGAGAAVTGMAMDPWRAPFRWCDWLIAGLIAALWPVTWPLALLLPNDAAWQ